MSENNLQNFEISEGLTDLQIRQLVAYSREDEGSFTSDRERFRNEVSARSYLEWVQIYSLTDGGELKGIAWFGHKSLPARRYTAVFNEDEFETTFAIRLYADIRGQGLALPFMQEVFDRFKQSNGRKEVWLETNIHNIPAISLYKRFGFTQVSEKDEENRIIMILSQGTLTH
jgi:ribosomal protein S18 acetylase RimI-like enzyme